MDMLWPGFVLLLGLLPVLVVIYIWMLRRRRRYAVRFSSLSLVREALLHQSYFRRHLPFILFLLALCSLVMAPPAFWSSDRAPKMKLPPVFLPAKK